MFTYVYLLKSGSDGKFYVGCTSDLRRRIRDHNAGKSFATKGRRPLQLIYYEAYPNRKDAETREFFSRVVGAGNTFSGHCEIILKQKLRRVWKNT